MAQFGFFRRFEDQFSDLYAPIDDGNEFTTDIPSVAAANALAAQSETQWVLLAHAIPSQSYAVAANPLARLGDERNYDMQANRNNPWTDDRSDLPRPNDQTDWLHSDIKNVAMPYVHPTFETMLRVGGFLGVNNR